MPPCTRGITWNIALLIDESDQWICTPYSVLRTGGLEPPVVGNYAVEQRGIPCSGRPMWRYRHATRFAVEVEVPRAGTLSHKSLAVQNSMQKVRGREVAAA